MLKSSWKHKLLSKWFETGTAISQLAAAQEQKKQAEWAAEDQLQACHCKREARPRAEKLAKKERQVKFEEEPEWNKGIKASKNMKNKPEFNEWENAECDRVLAKKQQKEEKLTKMITEKPNKVAKCLEARFEETKNKCGRESEQLEAKHDSKKAERHHKHDKEKVKKANKKCKKEEMEKQRQAQLAAKQAEEEIP